MSNALSSSPAVNDRLVTPASLRDEWRVPYSACHLRRLERQGKFPRRFKLGGSTIAWLESEVRAWVAQRAATRDAGVSA